MLQKFPIGVAMASLQIKYTLLSNGEPTQRPVSKFSNSQSLSLCLSSCLAFTARHEFPVSLRPESERERDRKGWMCAVTVIIKGVQQSVLEEVVGRRSIIKGESTILFILSIVL